jgi:hypothetical protein
MLKKATTTFFEAIAVKRKKVETSGCSDLQIVGAAFSWGFLQQASALS